MILNPEVEENPTRPPGTCFSCGAGSQSPGRDWFLDTDVDYYDTPMYRIQICNICFDLLANKCGYIKKGEEVAQYKRKIAKLEGELDELSRYKRIADSLGFDIDRLDRIISLGQEHLAEVSNHPVKLSSTWGVREEGTASSVESGEAGLPESADDEGMAVVRASKSRTLKVNI